MVVFKRGQKSGIRDKVPDDLCRQCGKMVTFTTKDGRLIAVDTATQEPHPCKKP